MKVKEKFVDNGLFKSMNKYGTIEYSAIIPVETMDLFYISNYGERTLSAFGRNNTVDDIAKTLISMFKNKWDKLYDLAISNIDIDYNYSEKQIESVDNIGENESKISSINTNSVNAYNDNDFVNDKQDENNTSNTGRNTTNKKREYIKQVLNGSKTDYYDAIVNYLQNNYFNDIIIKDINEFLTLSIFE